MLSRLTTNHNLITLIAFYKLGCLKKASQKLGYLKESHAEKLF